MRDQFDYVFDWTILKYPQIGSSSGTLASAKPALNPGPSAERTERPSVGQDFRDRIPGEVEAFSRRNGSGHGLPGDTSRHRSTNNAPSSKDVESDSERTRSSSRNYVKKWESSSWGRNFIVQKRRASHNDCDHFKLMLAKIKKTGQE
ncbi:hypothetical protein M0R45_018478 [Rubus argutus]|uniref:Large ribosomal subunit protein eL14 domain-containing protein n=1 Tax=Rubus argutus TaxID=59490 RepID=A0AAW1X2M7_RUBAR